MNKFDNRNFYSEKINEYFDKALKLYPEDIDAYYLFSVILKKEKQYDKSIEYLNKCIEYNNESFRKIILQDMIGCIYLEQKKYDKALDIFKITANSYKASSLENLSKTYEKLGKIKESCEIYERIANRYEYYYWHFGLYEFYKRNKMDNKAREYMTSYLSNKDKLKKSEEAYSFYMKIKQPADFLTFCDKFFEGISSQDLCYEKSLAAFISGDLARAEIEIQEAIDHNPKNPIFAYMELVIAYKRGNKNLFNRSLKKLENSNTQLESIAEYLKGEITIEESFNSIKDKWYRDNLACRLFTIAGYKKIYENDNKSAKEMFTKAIYFPVNNSFEARQLALYELNLNPDDEEK